MEVPCSACGGTGLVNGQSCLQCGGDGSETTTGIHEVAYGYMLAAQTNMLALIEEINTILDKCNAIIAEQAAQREDLTAALAAIWDKVKGF